MVEKDRSFVSSLDRGLRVIAAFDGDHPVLSVSQAAKRADISRAAARRFLITLAQLGYVREDDRQNYHLTARVLGLGYSYMSSLRLEQHAGPALEKVMAATGRSCSMAVLDGSDIVYVMRVDKPQTLHLSIRVGERLPALSTALGRVLLANRTDQEIHEAISSANLKKATPETVVNKSELHKILMQVREQDYACVINQQLQGWASVSVPIRNNKRAVVAAINASALNHPNVPQFTKDMLPKLREAAAEIEMALKIGAAGPGSLLSLTD
jgi:IclR family pca regulon transcriptional regulator